MSWIEIVVEVARAQAENFSDALMELGALSVSVEDADEGTDAEQPLFGEPGMEPKEAAWERSRVIALTPTDFNHAELVELAAAHCKMPVPEHSLRSVADQDWVRLTQSQFEPMLIGKGIWVVPSWHSAPDPTAIVLELDPGLAFGTGSHPTTRLCMEWLEENPPLDKTVLDYGCGSGILAIVAKKLGAGQVEGIDIDPQAVVSAEFNAVRNHCEIDFSLPNKVTTSTYDVVVANILSNPLKLMAPMLSAKVAAGGALVLSGVLARQADEVTAAYAPFIALSVWQERDGWVALHGRRPS
ncbi:50S ribosomal protein L11 methyltransferase [Solimicrobium silvestre]|uniref:Ribosomal protein L11 methyltransferase n=1 Tax=Solimicrobium silvestre TaxID=2099400 RepID=A0A2S9GUF5_9BURK|nr:50S ribosomal protein L11 methyltransferase [Solimicrobium silvestre]PRC91365.1 prmA: ribosomal protein L11 methyltransferase [Solimicrobium silvestre]